MRFNMSFVKDTFNAITGKTAAAAAQNAALVQTASADKAIESLGGNTDKIIASNEKAIAQSRADLQPFRDAGVSGIAGLTDLVTNPKAQADFITNNPFFEALSKQASTTLFNNNAARGKVGSGSTAEALQNSLLLLGSDLVNQNVTQRQNIVTMGANAAAVQSSATQNTAGNNANAISTGGTNIANLITSRGNAQAAGLVGAADAETQGIQNLVNTAAMAAGVALSDKRAKTDIKEVGKLNNGLPVYTFRYKGKDHIHMNVMAQDVEKVMPHAVMEINGFKYVNMEKICH